MYVDPTVYQDVTDAVRDFAKELQRDWVVLNSLIGGGKCQLLFTISPVATPYSPHLSCNLPTVAPPYPPLLHPANRRSTLPTVAPPYPLSLHPTHRCSTLQIVAPPYPLSIHPTHNGFLLPTVAFPYHYLLVAIISGSLFLKNAELSVSVFEICAELWVPFEKHAELWVSFWKITAKLLGIWG